MKEQEATEVGGYVLGHILVLDRFPAEKIPRIERMSKYDWSGIFSSIAPGEAIELDTGIVNYSTVRLAVNRYNERTGSNLHLVRRTIDGKMRIFVWREA